MVYIVLLIYNYIVIYLFSDMHYKRPYRPFVNIICMDFLFFFFEAIEPLEAAGSSNKEATCSCRILFETMIESRNSQNIIEYWLLL